MKLAQLLEQLNQLAKERPEALEMEVTYTDYQADRHSINSVYVDESVPKNVDLSYFCSAKKF